MLTHRDDRLREFESFSTKYQKGVIMKERKSFLFYYDWFNVLKKLNYSQVGRVVMAIEEYEKSGIEPQFRDSTSKIAFTVISNTLIRDAEKYEKKCLKNAENARKRWDNNANVYERINENANYADKERDKDKDKDTDRDIENDSVSSSFSSKTVCEYSDDFLYFWKEYPKKVGKGDAFKKWKKANLTNADKINMLFRLSYFMWNVSLNHCKQFINCYKLYVFIQLTHKITKVLYAYGPRVNINYAVTVYRINIRFVGVYDCRLFIQPFVSYFRTLTIGMP